MAQKQPTELDRNIAHAIVGIAAGAVVGRKTGWLGFVVAAIVGIAMHKALDAPLAEVIAEIT